MTAMFLSGSASSVRSAVGVTVHQKDIGPCTNADLAQPRRPVGISFTGEPKQAGISRRNHLEGFDVGEVVAKPGHHFAFLPASTGSQSRSVPHAVFTPCFLAQLYSRSVPVQISRSFRRVEGQFENAWSADF